MSDTLEMRGEPASRHRTKSASRDDDARVARRALIAALLAASTVALLIGGWVLRELLLLTAVAVLVAILLTTLGELVRRLTGLPPPWSTLVAGAVLAVGGVAAVVTFLPTLGEQIGQLLERLPAAFADLKERLAPLPWLVRLLDRARAGLGIEAMADGAGGVVQGARSLLGVAGDISGNILFVLFAAVFLAADPVGYREGVLRLVPPMHRPAGRDLLGEIARTLRAWLGGELLVMVFVGVATGTGLALLGVPLALALGVLTAMLNIVSYIGPIVAAIPALMLALTQGPETVLWVAGLYVLVQQIEGNLVLPLVQRQAVSTPPALVLFAVFAMGTLFGLLGVLLATPTVAVLIILIRRLYVEGVLEAE